jgi:chitin disaccharide deacetylase
MSGRSRLLIVNADDFGRDDGVNAGVVKAHERGIVTSASLTVRWPAAAEAAAYARANPRFGVGLHLDLGEWVFEDGVWRASYEVVSLSDRDAIAAEARRQLDSFRELLGRDPTHLDSHQHVHRRQPTAAVAQELAAALGIPLRSHGDRVWYRGDLYAQTAEGEPLPPVTADDLIAILRELQPGVTELACHPGEGPDIDSSYSNERELEVALLCDPRVVGAIETEAIVLCSFADVQRLP